uniref:MmcB family DNA repair protein n=1 Tax=Caenorhabditis tropicalis TaxID=1561998 RepID=A0A1I7TNN4_9PELO
MWKVITKMVNEKFEGLEALQVAQVKKSYSNYKRRHPELVENVSDTDFYFFGFSIVIIKQSADDVVIENKMKTGEFVEKKDEINVDDDLIFKRIEDNIHPSFLKYLWKMDQFIANHLFVHNEITY